MAGLNVTTPSLPLMALGGEGGDGSSSVATNYTAWTALNASELIDANDTQELDVFSNASSPGGSHVPYNQRLETYLVPCLFAVIFIVGVIGNGALIVIFMLNKNLRKVPNTYLISLALGDLLVLFFTVPFVSTIYTIEYWPYGTFECKFSEFIRDVSVGVTVFTLTALSADRYRAIVSPIRKAVSGTARSVTLRVTAAIWVVSLVLATPAAVFTHVRNFGSVGDINVTVCYPFPDTYDWYTKANVLTKALVYYFLPLLVIAAFYILMARHLLTPEVVGDAQVFQRQIRTRRKVAKVVLCFIVIFAVCFLPTHVFMLWFYFDLSGDYNDFWHALRIMGFCLSFINSCINPIALYCISGTFRKQYNRYLFCCCCWVHPERTEMHSIRSGASQYRSSTLRPLETITLTTLLQERSCPNAF